MTTQYNEGNDAYERHAELDENPYDPQLMPEAWGEWRYGWLEAQDAVKEAHNRVPKATNEPEGGKQSDESD